jgi:hypothetical protein
MPQQYVANQPIRHGWALAYDTGHVVPADNVRLHGYDQDGLVDLVDTDAPPPPAATIADDEGDHQPSAEPAADTSKSTGKGK